MYLASFREADEIALEHLAWSQDAGFSILETIRAIGIEPAADDGPDDAVRYLARAWLMIGRLTAPRPLRNVRTPDGAAPPDTDHAVPPAPAHHQAPARRHRAGAAA